jgi:LacI family transcriptional regulator
MKRPTQKDVARKAGVSRSTVSYVLNDQTDLKVPISAETRQRVLHAIAELGYEPDARAQSLRRGHTKIVGMIFPVIQNPFFWQIVSGISSELQSAGYSLHLSQHPLHPEEEVNILRELMQQHVDGFILLGSVSLLPARIADYLRKAGRPIVEITAVEAEFDHVLHAYASGTRVLLTHFLELGHRQIGLIYGVYQEIQGLDRLFTYRQVMQEAGVSTNADLEVHCGDTLEDAYQAAYALLNRQDRPTALLVINDMLAIAVIRAANDLGLTIPGDLSVAGFDDIPFANYTVPRLTTVSGKGDQSGRDAVRLLLRRLTEPELPQQVTTADVQLIVRESTGPVNRLEKGRKTATSR